MRDNSQGAVYVLFSMLQCVITLSGSQDKYVQLSGFSVIVAVSFARRHSVRRALLSIWS